MLYVYAVLESSYFKFGWTERHNPYDRINNGFWTNLHPDALCQKGNPENPEKLGPENLNLIFLFEGDNKLETVIKSLFPPDCGEFWRNEVLGRMIDMVKQMAVMVPIPPRPEFYKNNVEKMACCTGTWILCNTCDMRFKKYDKFLQHKRDVHESAKFSCVCGKKFPRKGNLDRHVVKSCKGKR